MFSNNRVLIISGLVVFFKTEIKYTLIVHDRNKFNACIIYTRINEVGTVIKCRMFLIKYNLVYTKFELPRICRYNCLLKFNDFLMETGSLQSLSNNHVNY